MIKYIWNKNINNLILVYPDELINKNNKQKNLSNEKNIINFI